MIKRIPTTLKLPNYSLKVTMDTDDQSFLGTYVNKDLEIRLSKSTTPEQSFDKYVFCLFTAVALGSSMDLKVGSSKMHTFGGFLFHLLHRNSMKKAFKDLRAGKILDGVLDVPSFLLNWRVSPMDGSDGVVPSATAGYLAPLDQRIVVSAESNLEFRPVILIHEIVEWMAFFYSMEISHTSIQTLAEYVAYVIDNNNFTD